ncbi:hypothetical protein [Halalkalicoccus salilacus]|uniref:hypothetical protein n=1 Tax=Halalkalicoccus TaxID=332246 RepID=UPI002F96922F
MDKHTSKIKEAVKDPNKALTYLKGSILGSTLGYPLTKYRIHGLPKQTDYIRKLEKNDEWLLIILDACRYDRFANVFDEYFTGSLEPISSAGYTTFEYVRENWPNYHEITYVTGAAPITADEFDFNSELQLQGISATGEQLKQRYDGYRPVDHIEEIIEVWRTDWNEDLGVCPPEPVTTKALDHADTTSKMVVHYFQPHAPFIGEKKALTDQENIDQRLHGGAIGGGEVWSQVRKGNISHKELVEMYDSNLERALDSVCYLLQETDFENVVIMGDHGEALGELGIFGHGHPPHPSIRIVPWAEITSVSHDIDINEEKFTSSNEATIDVSVSDRLKELGYIE